MDLNSVLFYLTQTTMKVKLNYLVKSLAMIAALAVTGSQELSAQDASDEEAKPKKQEVKYKDLQNKLTIDKSNVVAEGGMIASYAPALEKAMPAVVTIFSSKAVEANGRNPQQEELFRKMFPDVPDDFFERFNDDHGGGGGESRKEQGLGSGVIITEDGYILTNNHVVGGADEVKVTLSTNKREYIAEIIGADPQTDVALIKIDAKGLAPIVIGDSSKLRIGDIAMAVGNPLGLEQTATVGIVSALGRNDLNITRGGFENFIQTDASINRGNSGGALVDANGRLIGVNTAIQSGLSGGNIGIGFAIPSNMALNIVERLLDGGGKVARGFLGVYLKELDANYAKAFGREGLDGVVVAEVGPDTPAEKGGMKPGDLIIGYNGRAANSMPKLRLDISNTDPGTKVEFVVVRKGKEESLNVILGDLEDRSKVFAGSGGGSSNPVAKPKEFLKGVRISDLDEDLRKALELEEDFNGVVVESVEANSLASEAGLRPGVVITQVDQKDVSNVAEAHDILKDFKADVLLLQVFTNGRRDILAVPLK